MILSDKTITSLISKGSLKIEPLEKKQMQPASVDIRLGNIFSVVEDTPDGIITLEKPIAYERDKSRTVSSVTRAVCFSNYNGIYKFAK